MKLSEETKDNIAAWVIVITMISFFLWMSAVSA